MPGTYHIVEAHPQGITSLLIAPVKGFKEAALIIAFVFFVGGVFGVMNATGAIEAGMKTFLRAAAQNPKLKRGIIPLLVILFAITGATFGLSEEILMFVLITVPLFISLGYDSILGIAVPLVGTAIGFGGAVTNPFTIGIAQSIAEVPIFSGWEYRMFCLAILTIISIIYLDAYARKLEKSKEEGLVLELDAANNYIKSQHTDLAFNTERKLVLTVFALTIVMLIVGATALNWYINEITALFLGMAIIIGGIYKMSPNVLIENFQKGAKEMMSACLVIAFSKGIIILATEGKIIDTILYSVAEAMKEFPPLASGEIMFFVQSLLNIVVPSGSGQAALTIPILAPLSDMLHITRQTAVLIFQLGDGINNMIIPTSGVTMGTLAIAKIPYQTWVKWIWPLVAILFITALILLIGPLALFHYGPR